MLLKLWILGALGASPLHASVTAPYVVMSTELGKLKPAGGLPLGKRTRRALPREAGWNYGASPHTLTPHIHLNESHIKMEMFV